MKRWALRALLLGACLAGFWLVSASAAWADAGIEGCFTSKINGARAANGRASLRTRSDLVAIARRHSQRMASSGTIFHNGNLANEAPSDWQKLGENVGMGPTCDDIHTAFMNSASHRRNILDPDFNTVGVGVVRSGDSTIFVTEVFMKEAAAAPPPPPSSSGTTATAPSSSGTTTTTTRRTTTKRTTSTTKAQPAAPPPPPPPPPPGSKVKGNVKVLFNLVEKEDLPTDEELKAYVDFRKQLEAEKAAREKARREKAKRDQDTFHFVSAFLSAVLSGQI